MYLVYKDTLISTIVDFFNVFYKEFVYKDTLISTIINYPKTGCPKKCVLLLIIMFYSNNSDIIKWTELQNRSQPFLEFRYNFYQQKFCCLPCKPLLLESMVSQSLWEHSPKPLGNPPKPIGEPPQSHWGTFPKPLGDLPKGFGRAMDQRCEVVKVRRRELPALGNF